MQLKPVEKDVQIQNLHWHRL